MHLKENRKQKEKEKEKQQQHRMPHQKTHRRRNCALYLSKNLYSNTKSDPWLCRNNVRKRGNRKLFGMVYRFHRTHVHIQKN